MVRAFIEEQRPTAHLRAKVHLAFRLTGQSVEIFQVRPKFERPGRTTEDAVAKATHSKANGRWKVFWQRADLKWHRYDPVPDGAVIIGAVLGLGLWTVLLMRRSGKSENPWMPTTATLMFACYEKGPCYTGRMKELAMKFTAVFQQVPEGYIAFVEELPGANTQAATLEEARENLAEAVELVLEANRTLAEEMMKGQTVIRESFPLRAA